MALQLQPTLGEIRQSVLARCGLATTGNIPRNIQGILDERIRSAQLQLYEEAYWLANYVQREITLDADTTDYDCPDDTEPGNIDWISVKDTDGRVYEMSPGYIPSDPNVLVNESASLPLRYNFIDQIIRIQPVPDTTRYTALVLWYRQRPGPFIEDGERAVVDGEALKMLAEILVKDHFGGQNTTKLEQALGRYVMRRKGKQSDGSGWSMGCGGKRSLRGQSYPKNGFNTVRVNATSGDDWRPW